MEKDFLGFVAEIMEVDISDISLDTRYKDGVWDSIMMLTLVMEIEAEYGVSIPMEMISKIKSLRDLYCIVEQK